MGKDRIDLAAFSEEDIACCLERELQMLRTFSHSEHPKAILLAGQPGAGKTMLSAMLIKRFAGDAAFVNADEYRRHHPTYKKLYAEYGSDAVHMTNQFSSEIANSLIQEASDRRVNLIIEGTGRTTEVPLNTARVLTAKGYEVEMGVIAARPEESLLSTLLRFYQMNEGGTIPRATAVDAHDHVVSVLPQNLDVLCASTLISRVSIWNRELRQIYDSTVDQGLPSESLLGYWNAPWEEEELFYIQAQMDILRAKEQEHPQGQSGVIDELARRVRERTFRISDSSDFEMKMQ